MTSEASIQEGLRPSSSEEQASAREEQTAIAAPSVQPESASAPMPASPEQVLTDSLSPPPAASSAPAAPSPAEPEEPSFAEMLAEHEKEEAPQSRLTPGQRVSVRIVAITGDTIFVSTGS